ncbi:hypothetical protein AgCh_030006 [Apium graveolens]
MNDANDELRPYGASREEAPSSRKICKATSVLFLKQQQKRIIVGTDGLIPLSRSLVAVPFESDLYLDISLVVDGHTLQATMSFSARKTGVLTKNFKNFSATVNWDALYYNSKKVNEA